MGVNISGVDFIPALPDNSKNYSQKWGYSVAVFIEQLRRAVGADFMRMLTAEGAVYRPAIAQVVRWASISAA
jgi:hypothetical protein